MALAARQELEGRPLYFMEPAPQWVADADLNQSLLNRQYDSPLYYIHLCYEHRCTVGQFDTYCKTVVLINDESHIESNAVTLFELSPESETVSLHTCSIHRNGKALDRLLENNIRVLQRETALERHVTSDQMTVELLIDDLRVGDVLEIASTRSEFAGDHAMSGKYFHNTDRLEWGVPIKRLISRFVNEGEQALQLQRLCSTTNTNEKTQLMPGDSHAICLSDVAVKQEPDYIPHWYWPDCLIATSDNSWEYISSDLHSEYAKHGILNADIDQELIDEIDDVDWADSSLANITSLVRFVQNNIRYRSESNGIHTHTPKSVNETLRRRTGDCKDKSALLVALLAKLGVQAELVLVNAGLQELLTTLNPSPRWFNHMVARIQYNGAFHVVDATMQKQGGLIDQPSRCDFRYCLPITAAGSALAEVPKQHNPLLYEREDTVDFRFDQLQKCTLTVNRTFYSERADNVRSFMSSTEKSECAKAFLDQVQGMYDLNIDTVESVRIVEDDKNSNVLRTEEQYRFTESFEGLENKVLCYASGLHEDFLMPESEEFPVYTTSTGTVKHTVKALYKKVPGKVKTSLSEKNAFFEYNDVMSSDDTTVTSYIEFQALTESVAIEDIAACREAINKVNERRNTSLGIVLDLEKKTHITDHIWYIAPIALWGTMQFAYKSGYSTPSLLMVFTAAAIVGASALYKFKPGWFSRS